MGLPLFTRKKKFKSSRKSDLCFTGINMLNFENFNENYSNFIQKVMGVIDLVAPIK